MTRPSIGPPGGAPSASGRLIPSARRPRGTVWDPGEVVASPSPWAASRPWRSKRDPRPDEIALLRGLAAGPARVTGGPLGRCSKRGWCRAVLLRALDGDGLDGTALFELTAAGRALIEDRPPT